MQSLDDQPLFFRKSHSRKRKILVLNPKLSEFTQKLHVSGLKWSHFLHSCITPSSYLIIANTSPSVKDYQLIQVRHQRVRFSWNSRALQFKLRVMSWGRFLSDEYGAPVEEKTNLFNWILEFYCASSTVQFLAVYIYIRAVKSERRYQAALSI